MFDHFLCEAGFEPRGGQIVDATLIPVPIQRNTREENQEIKAGNVPTPFTDNQNSCQRGILTLSGCRRTMQFTIAIRSALTLTGIIDSFANMTFHWQIFTKIKCCLPALIDPKKEQNIVLEILPMQLIYLRNSFRLLALRVLSMRRSQEQTFARSQQGIKQCTIKN